MVPNPDSEGPPEMSGSDGQSAPFCFLGEEPCAWRHATLSGFEIRGFSARSPTKSSDNEDSGLAISYGKSGLVLAVADGAGGLPAGRKASNTMITTLAEMLPEAAREETPMRIAIMSAIEEGNRRILEFSNGSATTLTVVGIDDHELRHYQVGDSIALLIGQRGKLKAQTMQHSPVGFAVEAGLLDEQEAMMHADRHYVSNFVGLATMRIDVGSLVPMAARDTIVIASDGLSDNLHLSEIIDIARHGPIEDCLEELGELSQLRMLNPQDDLPSKADDNTVLIARREQPRRS